MHTFRPIVLAAALAGLLVGLAVTVAQQFGTVPLILQAEVYERAAEASEGGAAAVSAASVADPGMTQPAGHHHEAGVAAHDHGDAWEPEDGLERNALTAVFNVIDWIGFGLVLLATMSIAGVQVGWREGFVWGLAAYLCVAVAPSFGLPPELPGVPAAPIDPRQAWWIATVVMTAAGLYLVSARRSPVAALIAVALFAAPHLYGAPQLDEVVTNVPEALSHRFTVAVMLTTLLSWSLLGALAGALYRRFALGEAAPRLATA